MGLLPKETEPIKAKFKTLPLGIQRLLIAGCVMLTIGLMFVDTSHTDGGLTQKGMPQVALLIIGIVAYWACVFAGIWIWEGFKSEQNKSQ